MGAVFIACLIHAVGRFLILGEPIFRIRIKPRLACQVSVSGILAPASQHRLADQGHDLTPQVSLPAVHEFPEAVFQRGPAVIHQHLQVKIIACNQSLRAVEKPLCLTKRSYQRIDQDCTVKLIILQRLIVTFNFLLQNISLGKLTPSCCR